MAESPKPGEETQANPTAEKTLRGLLTDAMAISSATAIAYFLAFLYEWGYCSYFNIPASLISVSLQNLLVAAGVLGTALLVLAYYAGMAGDFWKPSEGRRFAAFDRYVGVTVVGVAFGLIVYGFSRTTLYFVGGLALFGLGRFALPLALWDRSIPFLDRFAQVNAMKIRPVADFDSFLGIFLPAKALSLFYFFVGFCAVSWSIGYGQALNQARFLTLKQATSTVILRHYGDLIIAAEFSREQRTVSNSLSLLWTRDAHRLDLKHERVGPLIPIDDLPLEPGAAQAIPDAATAIQSSIKLDPPSIPASSVALENAFEKEPASSPSGASTRWPN